MLQEGFLAAAAEHPGQVGVQIGYHEAFSHRIMGGADVILVPSRFEPCGLTQLYGLKYGTLPLVRRTGGLADTVSDSSLENLADGIASGFVFEDSNAGRCCGRFGVLSSCGPVHLCGVTFSVRRCLWTLAGTLRRSHTATFINA